MKSALAAAFWAVLLSSCADTRTVMLAAARPATTPDSVRVYTAPPPRFEQMAILNSSGGTSWMFADRSSMDTAVARLRVEAAAIGANGLLLQQVYDEPEGGLSIGVGGFGWGGGRHNFYGGGGDVGVGGPLLNRRVRALAIYVR